MLIKKCPKCKTEYSHDVVVCNPCKQFLTETIEKLPEEPETITQPVLIKTENSIQDKTVPTKEANPAETKRVFIKRQVGLNWLSANKKIQVHANEIVGREVTPDLNNIDTISRKHCLFLFENGNFYIKDLGSANGTMINNQKCDPDNKYFIKKNDLISLADQIFKIEDLNF